jgi:protein TonB
MPASAGPADSKVGEESHSGDAETSSSSSPESGALALEGETVSVSTESAQNNLIESPGPVYPPLAKQARIQDRVKLQVVISKTGTITSVKLVSGHPFLAPSAIEAVKQWHYRPFIREGRPVAVTTEVEVPFTLE